MKIGDEIPMAKEVVAMTIEDLIVIASKYDMYLNISLTPLNKEEPNEDNQTELRDPDTDI